MDSRQADGRTDTTKYIISLASRSIISRSCVELTNSSLMSNIGKVGIKLPYSIRSTLYKYQKYSK